MPSLENVSDLGGANDPEAIEAIKAKRQEEFEALEKETEEKKKKLEGELLGGDKKEENKDEEDKKPENTAELN